ncbi:Ctdspl2 [Symbiodinium pilosum]|uniref:Ctdspl2 protein n=1 Tax=Symbiodinium pilosum TaxID=2952 RepID=A0A812PFB2_SYMPI|nr:Ctdspl2 [Symbiodinium pilosum]
MATVAVRRPQDFSEAGHLSGLKSCAASCRDSRMRRPRQVAPAGWTMCECEADKEWVLCDRVEAFAAEMAENLQRHIQNRKDSSVEDAKECCVQGPEKVSINSDVDMKQATMRFAEMQFEAEQRMDADEDDNSGDEDPSAETKLQMKRSDAKGTKEDNRAAKKTRAERKAAWRAAQKALEGEATKDSKEEEVEESLHGKARGKARRARKD